MQQPVAFNLPPGVMQLAMAPNAVQPLGMLPPANAPHFAANPLAMQALMLMLQQPQQGQADGPIMGALPGAPPVLGGLNVMPPQWAGEAGANPPVFVPGWAHGQMAPMPPPAAQGVGRRRPAALSMPAAVSWQQFTVNCYNMELWRAAQAADRRTAENLLKRYVDLGLKVLMQAWLVDVTHRGTNPNAVHDGQPALWMALRHGHHLVLQLLLDWGATPATPIDNALLYYCVDTGASCLLILLCFCIMHTVLNNT